MNAEAFCAKLERVAFKHDLTASDLAIWFARPRPTMRTWLAAARGNATNAHWPTTATRTFAECERRLKLLERSPDFPVPYEVLKHARKAYIEKAYINANNGGVSRGGATDRGALLSRRARSRAQV